MNDYFRDNKREYFIYLEVVKLKFEINYNRHMKANHEVTGWN